MLVTVFVFLGIEGASVYSRFAKKREDVGRATVLGFLGVLALFMAVTMLSYGVMGRPELAGLRQPSVAGVLEAVVGHWGAVFISVGLIVSVLGAYLAWTLMAAEVLFSAANDGDHAGVPGAREREQGAVDRGAAHHRAGPGVPHHHASSRTTPSPSRSSCAARLSLIPYLLVAAYAFKLVRTRETYDVDPHDYSKDLVIATLATVYTAFALYAGGLKFVLMSCLIYGPGTFLFFRARTEKGHATFTADGAAAVPGGCRRRRHRHHRPDHGPDHDLNFEGERQWLKPSRHPRRSACIRKSASCARSWCARPAGPTSV